MKYTYLIIFSSLFILCACNQKKREDSEKLSSDLEKIDSLKGEFDPAYINDAQNAHLAVSVLFTNDQFTLQPAASSLRPGRPPYAIGDTSKPFVVRYMDGAGRLIGSYSFLNPGLQRACEGEDPGISIKDSVYFEILIPANRAISNIEILSNGKSLTHFQVPPIRDNQDSTVVNKVQ